MGDDAQLQEEKRALRREVRAWLAGLEPEEVRRRSAAICDRIRDRLTICGAQRVAAFVAMPTEPDLSGLWAWRGELAMPKVSGSHLTLWLVRDPTALVPGYRGILEPDERFCPLVEPSSLDAVLVPGLAFSSRNGFRLGRGGGFYDRLLETTGARRWGIAFDEQLRAGVPRGSHDARMDVVITCARELEIVGREKNQGHA